MRFGGWQKTSLLEYPGLVSTVVFTIGCNFRCPYCYNRDLALGGPSAQSFESQRVLDFLAENRSLYQAVMVSGGEPTLQPDLLEFLGRIKQLDLRTGVETNGTNPVLLSKMIDRGCVDFVAMDVKTEPSVDLYAEAAGIRDAGLTARVRESIQILLSAPILSEFRTTVLPRFHSRDVIGSVARALAGAKRFVLQQVVAADHTIEPISENDLFTSKAILDLQSEIAANFESCEVRNL